MKLNPGEVHIWSGTLNEDYHKLLVKGYHSAEEQKRAESFIYDIDAFLYLIKHNLIRIIIGNYLDYRPVDLIFKKNRYQKPYITVPNTTVQFNVSISSNRFVAVFCLHDVLGVDIELIRHIDHMNPLTTDFLTSNEVAWINKHPESMHDKLFFNIWTMKEAFIKAIGKGLLFELNTIDVISDNPIPFRGESWYIKPFTIFDDCSSALAINNPSSSIIYFNTDLLLEQFF